MHIKTLLFATSCMLIAQQLHANPLKVCMAPGPYHAYNQTPRLNIEQIKKVTQDAVEDIVDIRFVYKGGWDCTDAADNNNTCLSEEECDASLYIDFKELEDTYIFTIVSLNYKPSNPSSQFSKEELTKETVWDVLETGIKHVIANSGEDAEKIARHEYKLSQKKRTIDKNLVHRPKTERIDTGKSYRRALGVTIGMGIFTGLATGVAIGTRLGGKSKFDDQTDMAAVNRSESKMDAADSLLTVSNIFVVAAIISGTVTAILIPVCIKKKRAISVSVTPVFIGNAGSISIGGEF